MTATGTSPAPIIDIEDLSLDSGAHLLIKRALSELPVGGHLGIRGRAQELAVHLVAWCRAQGHTAMLNLGTHLASDPGLRPRLAAAIRRRHDALAQTSGLNEEVLDALVLLAAGEWTPRAIANGFARVQTLKAEMAAGRRRRLEKLGFAEHDAGELADLHTRNFM